MTSPDYSSPDYVQRVNAAIDHVMANLDQALQLQDIAEAACFSPYHFHRIFGALMGETPGQFVKRVRLDRALALMAHDGGRSLTQVALACGFSSSSDFSRCFKQRFGVPPSAFDIQVWQRQKRGQLDDLARDADGEPLLKELPARTNPDGFEATVHQRPPRTVAYIRVLDPYRGGVPEAAEALVRWAEARGAADGEWMGYMWENPTLTELGDCRYDVGVTVPAGFAGLPDGAVGVTTFPPMQVARVTLRGDISLEQRALDWIWGTWLPSSGYVPDEPPGFEIWHGRPFAHGLEHFELDLELPIRR